VWVCPEDDELVIPDDMNRSNVLEANRYHPLLKQKVRDVLKDEPGYLGLGRDQVSRLVTFPPSDSSVDLWLGQTQAPADSNDTLVNIAAPILAGFSLAAIVAIGTSASTVGRPAGLAAMAVFAASAVLLLFSIQMLAIGGLDGLRMARWPCRAKATLYELGLLTFLIGLGLFLWQRTWPTAALAGVAVVGMAVICDLALVITAWCRRNQWGHRLLPYISSGGGPETLISA
jgi:hypothetical protein